ncbi:MAG: lipid-A-disaccharide synthase [Campylobacteraceae bacterium]|jgi:lipid-A-disaccharide synthase|nr:lipid-A-disaccharide synthase [Campylobacteraceae bacterium]MBT3882680.1 lipid-A-disaccharide synthase [Campylobacteraceae bacterium]MBT4030406.1 lipid-A-disaccharide synthase [Campylobacteraceae bacterium]MBT5323369.1 lipid-A-disaccharide synthase [Campylobacteraceae bacterium]MBT5982809.1 lipid-A-disaccharide synthase [Campylobacteraceae bacterium]
MKLLVCALESSSNLHLKELLKYLPDDIELIGIFDKSLGTPNYDISDLAVMGFIDAIKRLPFFLKLNNEMATLAKEADKILLMDNSAFNLPLAKKIKKKYPDKEIIYYILPQAWAWKKKRIPIIEKTCDKLLSILPFEKDFYSKKEKITYVGHPLLDEINIFKDEVSHNGKIAFMPGSRKGEITKLMPIYRELVSKINSKAILIIPQHFTSKYIKEVYGDISNFTISTNTHNTLEEVDFAFICSGTATLEAAIIGTPFVLNYIAKPLDYFIAKNLVKIKYIGLANIFFDNMGEEAIHKEFIQEDVTVQNLLKEYKTINKNDFLKNSKKLRKYLQHGSSANVASIIQN